MISWIPWGKSSHCWSPNKLSWHLLLQYISRPYFIHIFSKVECPLGVMHESESVSLLVVSDSATPWTVTCQAPLSTEFSRQNTGAGCYSLLQGIFPTQGSNLGLLHCRQILYHLSHQGSSITVHFKAPFHSFLQQIFLEHPTRCDA